MKWDVLGADEVQDLCKNMGPRSSGKNHSKEDIEQSYGRKKPKWTPIKP
jgi:hypothetical protein